MTNDEHEFQKKLAIYQIAATAGATLGSILVALGISLIVFSSGLSLEAVGQEEAKSQFFRVISGGYLYQGFLSFFVGLGILLSSVITISKSIKQLK